MDRPIFLTTTFLQQHGTDGGLTQSEITPLLALAERIAAEPALQHCAQQIYAQTYEGATDEIEPSAETLLGQDANLLYLLLSIAAVPRLRAVHEQRGVPAAISCAGVQYVAEAAHRYAQAHDGQLGLEGWVLRYWFSVIASGDLYRLGRMEYIFSPFDANLRFYRHKASGRVQALAEADLRFTADGYFPYEHNATNAAHYGWATEDLAADAGWTTTLVETATSVTGTPISPYGYAQRQPLQLDKTAWELVVQNGDLVIDLHLPNFMPLTLDLLHNSLQQAMDFFPRYFPERPFKAFVCSSWIFNTQWLDFLPPTSNLLAFQRQGYLFPLPSDGTSPLYFLFGNRLIDLDHVPQDTTLRRAVIQQLRNKQRLRHGGFLILPDDVLMFGQTPYRSQEPLPAAIEKQGA